jgi:hypothetical protein
MIRVDRSRVIHGFVQHKGQWLSIDKKAQLEAERRRRIEDGYVMYQGEWVTIDEKLARTAPPAVAPQSPQQVVYNQTINRQVYNVQHTVDKRTFQETVHEHRHLHVDPQALGQAAAAHPSSQQLPRQEEQQRLPRPQQKQIPQDLGTEYIE